MKRGRNFGTTKFIILDDFGTKIVQNKFQLLSSLFGLAARRCAEARVGVTYRRAAVGTQTRQDAQRWGRQKDEWCLSHFMSVSTIQGLLGCPLAL